ncbi:MAG: hypothetical protein E6J64_07880 [Deltaproteobacteria bacterium]|nr:MAG: hypothetical protein E6J64_07880 [Deltaproteobacteria bacterium]
MSSEMIQALIPIVSVLAVFGFPVAIVFVLKYFKLKERELAIEVESRERSQKQQLAIEQRVERLEGVLLSLDHDVRARLGIEQSVAPLPSRPELLEAPPEAQAGEGGAGPARGKVR